MLVEYIGIDKFNKSDYTWFSSKTIEDIYATNMFLDDSCEITKVYLNSKVLDYKLIPSFNASSFDGLNVFGNLLIVEGGISFSIEYAKKQPAGSLNVLNGEKFFSIITSLEGLPTLNTNLNLKFISDSCYFKVLNPSNIFYSISINLAVNLP
ncbi:MAG: hypothetical protein ACRCW0_06080 [Clostridium sp.]